MDEFFTVAADTDALVAARKPRHVDARLKLRRSARLAATSPTATSPPSTAPHLTQSQAKAHAQAQTLRRGNGESFLDERRRKLEQRNRHVDDVKRAHQSRKSVLDADAEFRLREKSERAEKNRALLIDTQVRNNASRVQRAKQIAAQHKKNSAEKTSSLRQDLEDRLRASETRRRQLQSVPRSRLLSSSETVSLIKNVNPKETERIQQASAAAIQTWWRLKNAKRVVEEWKKGDLDLMKAKMMAFDRLIRIVQSKQVIKGATTVINYLKSFSSLSPATVTVAWKNPARVFLSLYMIVAHTKEIMPSMGEDEEAVKKVATEFLTKFEAFITTTSTQNKHFSVPNMMDLLSTWILYYNKFETWKERDTLKIVDGLIAHYLELENLWLSVKDQIDADVQWKPRVEEQQHQIFGRLQKFGAKAMDRFTAARRELHAQFGITDDDELADGMNQMSVDEFGHSSGDESKIKQQGVAVPGIRIGRDTDRSSSPSPSPSPSTLFSTSPQKFPGRIQQRMAATDSVSKPNVVAPQTSYARRSTTPSQRSASSRAASPANVELPQKPEAETPRLSTAPSSERLTGFPASTPGFGDLLTNEKLAHELTLDPEFSLKKPELSELETQVRAMARKAFFEQVTQEFARGNYGTHVPEFLKDIKDQLMSMVSEKGKIAAEIQEALDMDFITHQIKSKTLNLPSIMQYIVSKMAQLCAPLRDAAIRNITSDLTDARSGTDFVPIFDQILLVLDDMKLDLANYRLQTLRPHLKTQAVEYEKSKFKESLAASRKQSGANNDVPIATLLPRTKAWLAQTTQAKIQTARERNPENIDLPENRVRYTDILHDALLGLVFSNTAVTPDTIAETLVMDGARVFAFQNEGQLIVIVSALLMLVQNIVSEGRGDKGFLNALKDRLVALLKAPEGLSVENLALEIISSCEALVIDKKRGMLGATGRDSSDVVVEGLDEVRKGLIRNMVDKTLSTKDPVFGLLKRRVQACIKAHVVSGSFKREGLDKAGLDVVRTELEAFSYRVAIWVRYNGEVYGEWYDDILKDLI